MSIKIKIPTQITKEVEIEIPASGYWKKSSIHFAESSIHFAVFSENHCLEVANLSNGAKWINVRSVQDTFRHHKFEDCEPITQDEFNAALFAVTSNLIPIPGKVVYELEDTNSFV